MNMESIKLELNKSINFNNIIGEVLKQDYIFKFIPAMQNDNMEEALVLMDICNSDSSIYSSFLFNINQFENLYNKIGEVLDSIKELKTAINNQLEFINKLCSEIEDHKVFSVTITINSACTLNNDECLFGNIAMNITYIDIDRNVFNSDIISDSVLLTETDTLYAILLNYLNSGLIKELNFDMDRYNSIKKEILKHKKSTISSDLINSLEEYYKSITTNKV